MLHILFFILLFIIAIWVFGLAIVGFIVKRIFGIGHRTSSRPQPEYKKTTSGNSYHNRTTYSSHDSSQTEYTSATSGKQHKKIFTEDEGEYVDFEEIKE